MATTTTVRASPSDAAANAEGFLRRLGVSENIPVAWEDKDFYSRLLRGLLKVDAIDRGRVTCSFTVTPSVTNPYNTLHGGAVAAIAEVVGLGCAKTVVAGDKELFLGESSTAYLSAARLNAEVEVDGSILRQGRSVVVTTVEFRLKKTRQLIYTCRSTFYVMPVASL
ncbi:thioesterase family protein [Iris pallida]|uniref:Thioesterase family protein n=1 Tax=Iris pallida TaxID=29817 RepID=A0AAX6FI65_IRIPA|nr:thioesterase family protein [Iris pallida]KAJ6815695.1 thioesterase family protein [Iris pallida]